MKALAILLALTLAACGFQPVYKRSGAPTELSQQLREVEVPLLKGSRTEQLFSTRLQDLLNPQSAAAPKKYRLDVAFKSEEQPAIIQQDRRITRYRVMLTAQYTLVDLAAAANAAPLAKGKVTTRTSYDDLTSEFANYSARVDSEERAAQELAELLRQRLVGYFGEERR